MTELEKLIQRREQILGEIDAILVDGDGNPRSELTDDQQLEHDTLVEEYDAVSGKITEERQKQQDHQQRVQQQQGRRQSMQQRQGTRVPVEQMGGNIGGDGASLMMPGGPTNPDQPGQQQITYVPRQREPGIAISRMIRGLAAARGNVAEAARIVAEVFGDPELAGQMRSGARLAMDSTVAADGGFAVPPNYVPDLIELLRPVAVMRRMGAATAPLVNGRLTLPRQTGGSTTTYVGENNNIAISQPAGDQVSFAANKLAAIVPISNELLRWSNPSADAMVRNDLVMAIATTEDAQFIRGTGVPNVAPDGILNQIIAGNHINAAAGTSPTIPVVESELVALVLALMNANVRFTPQSAGWLFSPRTWAFLSAMRDANGNKVYPEMDQGLLKGYRYAMTTQIPSNLGAGTNESEIYFGHFPDIVIADEPVFMIEASNTAAYHDGANIQAAFSLDQTVVRVIAIHDIKMRHTESAAVLEQVQWGG